MIGARGRERRCQEASMFSKEEYTPCGAPADCIVDVGDEHPYWMCVPCADHNVRNRSGVRWEAAKEPLIYRPPPRKNCQAVYNGHGCLLEEGHVQHGKSHQDKTGFRRWRDSLTDPDVLCKVCNSLSRYCKCRAEKVSGC